MKSAIDVVLFICFVFVQSDETRSLDSRVPVNNLANVESRELVNINGTWYYVSEVDGTYQESLRTCNSLGMKLISIESAEKQNVIADYLDTHGHEFRFFWTSGANIEKDVFMWSGTGHIFDYTNWKEGQPDQYDDPRDIFVALDTVIFSHQWFDAPSTSAYYFICEQ